MSELSVYDGPAFKEVERVAQSMLKGHSEFKVAKELGMKPPEVRALWAVYREQLENDSLSRDAARDHLNLMIVQYDGLIVGLHKNLADLDILNYDEKVSAQKVATARTIADLQAKRVDLLQKAGLLDQGDLGDELAERENQEAIIVDILRNDLCNDCRAIVAEKLQKVTKQVEINEIIEEDMQ